MNIFLKELKSHRKSLIFWSIGVFLMVASGMAKYEAYSSSGQSMNDLVKDMPKALRVVLGFGDFDLSKISGYYGMFYIYLLLMTTIHAVMLGASIIAKEERDKTAEFLFVKPISRNTVIAAKLLAALFNILIVNLVSLLALLSMVGKYNRAHEAVNGDIALTMAGMFILQLLFMVIGSALAAARRNTKRSASLASGILLVTYMLSIVVDLNKNLNLLKYFSPFKYFEAKSVMYGDGLAWGYMILSIVLIIALTFLTFTFYKKRDLSV
jgi:ABC-2 type transport system permease protein